jgi:transcriptional regulator with GAF, ATPase, and Fis domain
MPAAITADTPKQASREEAVSNHHLLNFSAAGQAATTWAANPDRVDGVDGIVGCSPALQAVLEHVRRVAPTDMPVLITGETGSGKELLARAIHHHSRRAAKHLVSVNLAAIPQTLAAAELFGHERGAFTGADRLRVGRFEAADRGTLFLDEIGELSADLQVMLLRALQEGEFERLGGGTPRRVDVRVVTATNVDLERAMEEGRFREDLFYRLSVFPIYLPPLRERPEDIPALAGHFLELAAARLGRRFSGIEPASMRQLQQHHWPGNIRQLQNVIEQSAILCDDDELQVPSKALAPRPAAVPVPDASAVAFHESPTLEEVKKRYISHMLTTTRGNMLRAAAILDVDRRTLYRMVARYRLRPQTLRDDLDDVLDDYAAAGLSEVEA